VGGNWLRCEGRQRRRRNPPRFGTGLYILHWRYSSAEIARYAAAGFEFENHVKITIRYAYANHGRTPAIIKSIKMNAKYIEDGFPKMSDARGGNLPADIIVTREKGDIGNHVFLTWIERNFKTLNTGWVESPFLLLTGIFSSFVDKPFAFPRELCRCGDGGVDLDDIHEISRLIVVDPHEVHEHFPLLRIGDRRVVAQVSLADRVRADLLAPHKR